MSFYHRLIMILATGGGIGYSPRAPGTMGTLVAIPLVLLVAGLPRILACGLILVFIGLAIGVAHQAAGIQAQQDPQCVVIDEMAGLLVTMFAIPLAGWTIAAGFVLFRTFDIFKPGPVGWLDRNLKGGLGIVMDDIAAGILANICLWGMVFIKRALLG